MQKYISLLLLGWLCLLHPLSAQVQKGQSGTYALTNATLQTIANGVQTGTLLIQNGKIAAIGTEVSIPAGATVIDCSGKTIYPGFIDGGTSLGLVEIGSVDLTRDNREIGEVVPHVKALTAVNPNSVAIPVTRTNGITTVLTKPSGGILPGTAALIDLHGYTPDQMAVGMEAIVLNFPSMGRNSRFRPKTEEELKKDLDKKLKKLNEVWDGAAIYHRIDSMHTAGAGPAPDYYPEMAALMPAYRGEAKMLVEVNRAADIRSAIKWVQEHKIDAIFTGVSEGWRVAKELAEAKIPVITGPMLSTPTRSSDRYDRPYANAGLMHKAGVKVAIRSDETENVRNLPFNAGFAATYGMGKEAALRAITLTPAEIFGVADRLGSLEVGKQANLFVADGDPFEPATMLSHLFIQGWQVPMDSRHIQLYDEFLERSPGLKK